MSATISDLEDQIARDLTTDTRNRATDACRYLRLAMELCEDMQGSPQLSRAAHHMDAAATALLEVLA